MKLLLLLLLILVSACQPTAQKQTSCAKGETFQETTRRCIASVAALATPSPIQQVPVVNPTSVTYSSTPSEDVTFTATLAYSDANFDLGLACNINSTSGLNITTACACTAAGVCKVSFVGNANANGAASFTYTIIDNDGTSLPGTVNLVLTGVDDAPVVPTASVATWNEDVMNLITFGYTDVEGDLASACSVTSLSVNLTFPLGCNCVAGICSAFAQGTSNFNGTAVFQYQLYAGTSWSNVGTYTNTLNAVNDAPIGSNFSTSTNEDTAMTVTFTKNTNYTDPENDNAINFNIYNQTNVTVSPTSGACTAGVCTVTVTPNSNLNNSNTGTFSFDYTLTDASLTSIAKTVTLSVAAVDDAPVALAAVSSLSPAVPSEDTAVTVNLSYTDVDADLATGCTISSVGNGSAGACTCSGTTYPNSCSFTFTPNANINGTNIASFVYTITSGLSTSASVPIAFTLTAVNDTPTMSTIADVSDNESSTIVINGITVDEGGGVDENTQNVTITLASDNSTLLSTGQIAVNFTDLGNASATPMSLTLSPTSGQSGVANITVTATDNGTPVAAVSKTFKVTINNSAFSHGGWKNLKALGTKTNAVGSVLENPSVTLEWESFTAQGSATVAGYKVYRATSAGGQDFNSPLACNSAVNSCSDSTTVSSSVTTFIDSLPANIASGTTYYYVVRPVDGTTGLPTVTTETYSEIDVPIPPTNMALVHRWIANKEMCTKLGQTPDVNNDFRCTYAGPANNSGYYDLGYSYTNKHLFVDRFEAGCNYTVAPTCTSNGCIGNSNPNTTGCSGAACSASNNSVYYDRSSGTCYYKAAAAWLPSSCAHTRAATACPQSGGKGCIGTANPNTTGCNGIACTASAYSIFNDKSSNTCYYTSNGTLWTAFVPTLPAATAVTATAHLPPLLYARASEASTICTAQGKRLMTRKEQIASSAWSDSLSNLDIATLEGGLSMATNSSCNTMSGTGLTYTNGQLPTTGNEDTLPATNVAGLRLVRTSSTATASCSSRYGIQDLVGNVREWTSDTFSSCVNGGSNLVRSSNTFYRIAGNNTSSPIIGIETKRFGDFEDAYYVFFTPAVTESVTVTTTLAVPGRIKVIEIFFIDNVTTSDQVYNMLIANSEINSNFNLYKYSGAILLSDASAGGSGTETQFWDSSLVTRLINGSNGGVASGGATASLSFAVGTGNCVITLSSKVAGIYGNDISLSIADGTSLSSDVTNLRQIQVTINSGVTTGSQLVTEINTTNKMSEAIVLASSTGTCNSGVTSLVSSMSETNLSGGLRAYCNGSSIPYLSNYAFYSSGSQGNGPGGSSSNVMSWLLGNTDANSYSATYMHLPVGLPSTNNSNNDALLIGGSTLPAANLGGDQIDVNLDPYKNLNSNLMYSTTRQLATGGGWYGAYDRSLEAQSATGDKAGRYSLDLLNPHLIDEYTGFRCVKEAP